MRARNTRAERPVTEPGAVRIERQQGSMTVTLDRPAAGNRISAAMAGELMELVEEAEDDESLRLLVLTGAGDTFCRGFELGVDSRLVEVFAALSKPTLAIVNGDALDEGLELAMALDIRVALARARLALTQTTRGALPCFGGSQRLARLVGAGNALKMLLTGEPLDGREAMRVGLVGYLAGSRRGLMRCAREITEAILSRGPLAMRLAKEAVLKGFDMTLGQGIRLEEDLYALLQTTADRAEGVRAFMEKRKPLFKGI